MSKKNFLHDHTSMDMQSIQKCFSTHLRYYLAKDKFTATEHDKYTALAMAVKERMIERWIRTQQKYHLENAKRGYYLSLEYLMGRALLNNILNLNMYEEAKSTFVKLGINLEELCDMEVDAGLGNGGLGRLAACFLDSMATLNLPITGYGLRYEYGIFRQKIEDGYQVEAPDEWLRYGNVWEIERPEYIFDVYFGGHVEQQQQNGKVNYVWVPANSVKGIPYDNPIIGYGDNVNTLRLWSARASEEFDFADFSEGDYFAAVRNKVQAENLTKVLYPNDNNYSGKELRFKQQYFFVSCSLQDIMRRFLVHNSDFRKFPDKVAVQLNDTHPAIAIAELMHILVDKKDIPWDMAWDITVKTMGYTNHTLLPEALEKWPVSFFEKLLPRHLQIIYEINSRFLDKVSMKYPGDNDRLRRMSLIDEGYEKQVRMAYLSVIGSKSINGVADLHTQLIKSHLLKEFYEFYPKRFNNKTNGITQRRWLLLANPLLSKWITERIGDGWIKDLSQLKKLEKYADDAKAQKEFAAIKLENKKKLAKIIENETGITVHPEAIFDVQIKRIHEYKRQLMNLLHAIILYQKLKKNPNMDMVPRVFIFGGKAAPGYYMAKTIIKLANALGRTINNDEEIQDKLKIVFLPNYSVSLAENIIPAAEVSEQISTAGMEASGTGNMKLALNGALTIGTLDGANIEIKEEVGDENIFIFGLTADEVNKHKEQGTYSSVEYYKQDEMIKSALDLLFSNFFSLQEPHAFDSIKESLIFKNDPFFVLADLRAYMECQSKVEEVYKDTREWNRRAIMNVANMGKFSTDRVIEEYSSEIWGLRSLPIDMNEKVQGVIEYNEKHDDVKGHDTPNKHKKKESK